MSATPSTSSAHDPSASGGMDTFAALFEASLEAGEFGKEGEIVKGTVVAVLRDNVVIDIGGKSEGIIALHEFTDSTPEGQPRSPLETSSTSTSRAARTTTALSPSPRRRLTR